VLYKSVIIINTRALPCSLARCNVHWSAAALSGALPHSLEHCRTHWSAAMFTGALPHSVERYRTQWSTAALTGALPSSLEHGWAHNRAPLQLCTCGLLDNAWALVEFERSQHSLV